jgi:hypothetical protein
VPSSSQSQVGDVIRIDEVPAARLLYAQMLLLDEPEMSLELS